MFRALFLTVFLIVPAWPLEATVHPARGLDFAILRGESDIGRHRIRFDRRGEELHVFVEIDIEVRFAFLTVFSYTHRNHEVWRNGRLIRLDSRTDDDGTEYYVRARAVAGGLRVESSSGTFTAPAEIIPTSYWNSATVDRTELLDTQRGRLLDVDITPLGAETVAIGGRHVEAERYRVDGDLRLDLWYDVAGRWVKTAFSARGSRIEYAMLSGAAAGDGEAAELLRD